MEHKKIPESAMRNLPQPMALIKVMPKVFDYLDSDLKKQKLVRLMALTVAATSMSHIASKYFFAYN
ncbi:hypothetical protein [Butyrivibrio sp. FC2001]|uniref:hypothetical protein n=1 Tax=Butyrivibrio sp. FC2001 TaxID=1280671 RepID=UPI000406DC35|nr:hypothetical protein [Butyrivibrio sp. FC2001]